MNNDMLPNEPQTPATASNEPAAAATQKAKKNPAVLLLVGVVLLAVIAFALYMFNPGGIFSSGSDADDGPTVTITATGFEPETVKVKKGQSVEWVNQDSAPHQVASDPYPDHTSLPHLFVQEPLAEGETFTYTFDTAGTFTYHDQLKPADYKGTVIVE